MPIRYSDDVDRMRQFLAALGLTVGPVSRSGAWVELVAGGGSVGLHAASEADEPRRPGDADLSFVTDEPLEPLRDRLVQAGFADAHVIDEAFGRSLRVTDPDGVLLHIHEHDLGLYT